MHELLKSKCRFSKKMCRKRIYKLLIQISFHSKRKRIKFKNRLFMTGKIPSVTKKKEPLL
jgi:hypothetical protein